MAKVELKGPVVAVAGPTASGKSRVAMALARKFGGEIVCCDSMQIYRGMDIGTAKPTAAERAEIPHHMTDIVSPGESYSTADYLRDASAAIDGILSRGRLPVVCGGTGLYLESLLFERSYGVSPGATGLREKLKEEASCPEGRHFLWEELKAVDPESAAVIHENDSRRVIRALEIFRATGEKKSELDRRTGSPRYRALVLVLHTPDRSEQDRRIAKRAAEMLRSGLIEETARLDAAGVFSGGSTAAQAIGYKEILGLTRGETDEATALGKLITATRRYAKRQDTWFGNRDYAVRIDITRESPDPLPEAERLVARFLEGCGDNENGAD
ncbi:MAG: tRNA (adenosine(37)-N6)-dimethylallyltransferase MiaA [Clostridia bacterium]|nr:tRNA (adenosine(37)-N6)-dimethylallyltransferase MiaA [Clostridia bacterium]MBP5173746.1 tRNA (adenosine(37)-N6)-dimethylallyltransferase MiaA [Clostridia bacterium]